MKYDKNEFCRVMSAAMEGQLELAKFFFKSGGSPFEFQMASAMVASAAVQMIDTLFDDEGNEIGGVDIKIALEEVNEMFMKQTEVNSRGSRDEN